MARTNVLKKQPKPTTHEGAPAARIDAEAQLRRSVMACLLWEREFYEEGEEIATRIAGLVQELPPEVSAAIAIEAREKMHLRHVPLWVTRCMAPHGGPVVADTLARVIQRADELSEFVSLCLSTEMTRGLTAQIKRGLARAFQKFDEYQLAKYDRAGAVRLRDVLFLCHAKPLNEAQAALWKRLVDNQLATPETWEVMLSAGADKQAAWTHLLLEKKLGGLALLRNLRNMQQANVDRDLIKAAISENEFRRVLPFRFVSAAKAAPEFEQDLDGALLRVVSQRPKLPGRTLLVVDVSGSMYGGPISAKSDMNRALAACALAAIVRESCEEPVIYATAGSDATRQHKTALVPARRGMALVDAIHGMCHPLGGGGIFLNPVCRWLAERETNVDRMIVITDEQDCAIDAKDKPTLAAPLGAKANYLLNVASNKNGVGYGPKWTHIDGWSEAVLEYIRAAEAQ